MCSAFAQVVLDRGARAAPVRNSSVFMIDLRNLLYANFLIWEDRPALLETYFSIPKGASNGGLVGARGKRWEG